MDDHDRDILRSLQADGSLSNKALAEKIHLSPTPCWRRVKALEESGTITGYTALLAPETLGIDLTILAQVVLEDHHPDTVAAFDAAILDIPEVLECHMVSGDHDYALKIVARDMDAYSALLRDQLLQLPAVHRLSSNFVMTSKKLTTALPVYD
jgi:Lrp/AsnC family leucine-responsive transcriptional regulator